MPHISYSKKNDGHTWSDFREGDKDAFNRLYEVHASQLLRYGRRFSTDRYMAEDALQELFTDLWRTRQHLQEPSSVQNYLFAAYRRRLIRKLDKEKNYLARLKQASTQSDYSFALDIENHMILREEEQRKHIALTMHIEKLSGHQREIIYHRFHHELSIDDIASLMNISKKSVYNALARAIQTMRKAALSTDRA